MRLAYTIGVRCCQSPAERKIMSDKTILEHISALVDEEHRLRSGTATPETNGARLKDVEEQLDQCWDLLRQRRAKREFGEDPRTANVRDVKTIESYKG
jgi:hypothetical protein